MRGSDIVRRFVHGVNGLCVDITAGHTGNGTPVGRWGCNGGENQRWTLS